MDFIIDNYIWFLVIGVILIMALIGYIADKTDFTKKTKSKKAQKTEKQVENDDTFYEASAPEEVIPTLATDTVGFNFDLPTGTAEIIDMSDVTNNGQEPKLEETSLEELTVPTMEPVEQPFEESAEATDIFQIRPEPLSDVIADEPVKDEPVNEDIQSETVSVDLGKADSIEEVTAQEEDVWKF